jgi:hypothetical protein
MSTISSHELDLQIQLSLVAKIREAAQRYKSEPVDSGSTALRSYVAALEKLANHIEAKTRSSQLAHATARKHPLPQASTPRTDRRVIAFPSSSGSSPFTAA